MQVGRPTAVGLRVSRSTAHINIGGPYMSDRYLPISVRRLRHARTDGAPKFHRSPSDSFFIVQEGSRYGDICPVHVPVLLSRTSPPRLPTSSVIRPRGCHFIAPVDRSLTATSPDDVLLTSSNPVPHDDVMLTSSKKRANKTKKPYFRHFLPILAFFWEKRCSAVCM